MNYAGLYLGPEAPSFLQHLLEVVGGFNLYGKPNYRLVHAGFRMEPAGGTWVDWDAALGTNERTERPQTSPLVNEHGQKYSKVNNPWKRVVELRMTLKYSEVKQTIDGSHWWVLEKWVPPASYGGPEKWNLPSYSGGTMLWIADQNKFLPSQGVFPYEGAYEHTGFEFPQCALSERTVIGAVQRMIRHVEDPNRPGTEHGRILKRVYEQQKAEEASAKSQRQRDLDLINDCDTAFGNAPTSFGSGTKRRRSVNDFAERAGIRSHSGVS